MDPYSQYKKQTEYYEYFEKQKENYTDLTSEQNNSIALLAKHLFTKSKNNLTSDLTGILVDESMDTTDIFCMMIEFILYGLNILTNNNTTIFDLEESTDDIIYTIKSYLKSTGFNIEIHEEFMDDDVILYRDRSDYYCEILPKPPSYLCHKGWYVLNYRIIDNKKFKRTLNTPLEKFTAFFITKQNKLFVINFKCIP